MLATLRQVLRELISWPISVARTAMELPQAMERSIREANDLMEISREQLEQMRRQADQALEQAERMNELLSRVVRLTEPLERAQRSGEYVGERLKRAIFGPDEGGERVEIDAEVVIEETPADAARSEVIEETSAKAARAEAPAEQAGAPPEPPESSPEQ
jgi:hypothetical protein